MDIYSLNLEDTYQPMRLNRIPTALLALCFPIAGFAMQEIGHSSPDLMPWASLGIGGILAGMMFYFYRQDRKTSEELLKEAIHEIRNSRAAIAALSTIIKQEFDDGQQNRQG